MEEFSEMLQRWLKQANLNQDLKNELLTLKDKDEIYERFYKDLEFGTGGLRGILGAGTNRMNIYTVRKATQGFADYINLHYAKADCKCQGKAPSVALAYDSRINSTLFAIEAACVMAANGIKSYIYPELMPTPALSFAVRYYKCCAGIMVTASHNPSKYNGYKVYNEDGCQITLDAAAEVFGLIEKVDIFDGIKTILDDSALTLEEKTKIAMNAKDDKGQKIIETISSEVTEAYFAAVMGESMGTAGCEDLSVVYTPLNGAGNKPVRKILDMIGVKDIKVVKEQELPDGNFPTCTYPNPEKIEALKLGLELCRKLADEGKAPDILIATDPDSDRMGIAVRRKEASSKTEEFNLLTGNEVGILLLDFICQKRGATGSIKPMPEKPIAIKTIVTGKMAEKVAKNYGVEMIDVLTGFKFIGEQIGFLEEKGEADRYIFGFEESYGYLSGTYVRDKDAVNASMLICEMAASYKKEGKTLVDRLSELYEKYGYYENELIDFAFEGVAGMEKMNRIMQSFRKKTPTVLIDEKVVEIADYLMSRRTIIKGKPECVLSSGSRPIDLPKSDVLEYILEDGSSFIVRPSGTEPKLKIYLSAKGLSRNKSEEVVEKLKVEITKMINAVE